MLLTATAATAASAALANDTTASKGAGGLVIARSAAIDMASEDLFVSADQIRIHYVFRNRTARAVDTIVAFPMPDRDLREEYGGDVAYPYEFRTRVAGKTIRARLERKAVLKTRDFTALLKQLRVPVAPDSIEDATKAMDRLPHEQRQRLFAIGLAGNEDYDNTGKGMRRHLIPLWTVKDTYYWAQHFPAGRELVIDHRYRPGVGGSVESPISIKQLRATEDIRRVIRQYCIDRAFIAAVDRLARPDRSRGPGMPDQRVDYVLTTGANWRSPIGDFRLVVDKGKAGNLVSFCESGVRKIGPTQYEVRHRNWRPARDLNVLIIEPSR